MDGVSSKEIHDYTPDKYIALLATSTICQQYAGDDIRSQPIIDINTYINHYILLYVYRGQNNYNNATNKTIMMETTRRVKQTHSGGHT
jgi:hypothetical protein